MKKEYQKTSTSIILCSRNSLFYEYVSTYRTPPPLIRNNKKSAAAHVAQIPHHLQPHLSPLQSTANELPTPSTVFSR